MTERIYVVTGSNQGLGFHCAKSLYDKDRGTIVLACRNVAGAKKAAEEIQKLKHHEEKKGSSSVVVLEEPLNLSDLTSVRTYAKALINWLGERRIQSLINNAGIGSSATLRLSPQGYEEIFATNHLGHFLLTLLLAPHLSPEGRIINVSSEVHDGANKIPIPDPATHWPKTKDEYDAMAKGVPVPGESANASGGRRYSRSKLSNILFTNELIRRFNRHVAPEAKAEGVDVKTDAPVTIHLPPATIQVAAFNPGLMLDTGFVTGVAGRIAGGIAYYATPLLYLTRLGKFIRTSPVSGAQLADLATTTAITAPYYDGPNAKPSSEFSRSSVNLQDELWTHSLRWAQVAEEEIPPNLR